MHQSMQTLGFPLFKEKMVAHETYSKITTFKLDRGRMDLGQSSVFDRGWMDVGYWRGHTIPQVLMR